MKKIFFPALLCSLLTGLVVYALGNVFLIVPLENEIALVQARTEKLRIETEKTRLETEKKINEIKPLVESCQLQNPLDPNFANLTWPVVGAKTLSNYKGDKKHLEISLPPQSEIVSVAKGTILSITDLELNLIPSSTLVVIDHDNHLLSMYVVPNKIVVKVDQPILAGDLIGHSSEKETGSLHFELRHCYSNINSMDLFQN